LFTLAVALFASSAAWSADTPNLQALKTDLLVVTAHPDDETMMAATMARYADAGKVVALVVCTHGEGGGNGTGKESGAALGAVREAELRRCLTLLGTRHLYFLNQPDWAYTESVRATLDRWGHDETLRRLVRLVRLLRPEVICTMDPAPVGGQHGHHQAAGRLATEAFDAAADPRAFPELLQDEGLAPWRVRKLYWTSFRGPSTVELATDGKVQGVLAAAHPGQRYADVARAAARQHRSQGFDKFFAGGDGFANFPARPNGFLLVKARVPTDPRAEKDLFDGIQGADPGPFAVSHWARRFAVSPRMTANRPAPNLPSLKQQTALGADPDGPKGQRDLLAARFPAQAEPEITARLRPRGNVRDYRAWLRANGIDRLMARLPAHVTAVQGRSDNVLEVEVTNNGDQRQSGTVALEVPAGWALEKAELPYDVPARGMAIVDFRCKVPGNATVKSHDVTVKRGDARDAGQVDVVPALTIRRLAEALPVDAEISRWERAGIAAIPIPYTNVIQAKPKGPEECSGRFFVAHDGNALQVLVEVTDDTVARNIAPDDVKAHWRSTSVEICLDPKPRSENTFSTFKLGIFPQDTTGTVRAARDADAHPGELSRIKSRIQLASRLTPTGYMLEARIPWTEIGVASPKAGNAVGFNVILYHAGKKDARVGEDVGKSRLAWSFWPGVPGRPEVWGTAVLE
jgi:LmbE family N-acetylglucosaminyl deacetylase